MENKDASEVATGLWVGKMPPAGLYKRYWKHLVLCAQEYQPPADFFPRMQVHHCPLDDSGAPMTDVEAEIALLFADRVARWVKRGEGVLVTCAQGMNRSGLVAALALMRVVPMPPKAAIELVRRARGRYALSNPDFVRLIERDRRGVSEGARLRLMWPLGQTAGR